jgi:catechol-2,3-dioxygenase
MNNRKRESFVKDAALAAVSPKKLAHAVFRTVDHYAEMIEWYCLVLNAHKVFESDRITFLSYDEEHHRVAIARSPDLKLRERRCVGLDHLAFTYQSIGDLMGTYQRLKAAGIEPFCPVNHGPTTSLYYHDPDGNRIELQIDNFDDMAEATEHMKAAFTINPVGVLFEPDELVNQLAIAADARALNIRPTGDILPPTDELMRKLHSD